MNTRMKEILKEFESNQLEPDEPFRFHCTMCGKCCINREDILLNPRDMYNLAKELKMAPREVMNAYCETYIGSDSRLPVVRLKPRGEIKRCPLLKDRKCSVHKAKPTVCALFPIGRGIAQKKGSTVAPTANDIRYFLTAPGCGDDSETHTVREWLEDFGLPVEDELPSVGPGAVLSEIIASGKVPVARLDKVFRQQAGSRIAVNAKAIRQGVRNLEFGEDFQFVESPDIETSADKVVELYLQEVKKCGLDNVALLTPYRKKTATGANTLNLRLRDLVNPPAPNKPEATHGKRVFRLGDRVMQTKNLGEVNNGDVGYITDIFRGTDGIVIQVDFGDGREVEYDPTQLGYKSMPCSNNSELVRRVLETGADPQGVPGFFRTKAGWWSFVHQRSGVLIPVRDMLGRIQGLQLRLDNTENRKFRWISSVELTGGCGSPAWTHLAGKPGKMVVLTEGPMKADVIHALSGLTVLAVPGVNALQRLEEALAELRAQGVREIKTAFDMDYITNCYVQSAYEKLMALLGRMGFRYGTYVWDPRYKGLDDFIWAKLQDVISRASVDKLAI